MGEADKARCEGDAFEGCAPGAETPLCWPSGILGLRGGDAGAAGDGRQACEEAVAEAAARCLPSGLKVGQVRLGSTEALSTHVLPSALCSTRTM